MINKYLSVIPKPCSFNRWVELVKLLDKLYEDTWNNSHLIKGLKRANYSLVVKIQTLKIAHWLTHIKAGNQARQWIFFLWIIIMYDDHIGIQTVPWAPLRKHLINAKFPMLPLHHLINILPNKVPVTTNLDCFGEGD